MKCPNNHSIPHDAAFCPTCGSRAVVLINRQMFADFEDRAEVDLDDVPMMVVRPRWPLFATAAALIAGVAALGMLALAPQNPAPVVEVEQAQGAPEAVASAPIPGFVPEDLTVAAHPAVHTLAYKGLPLLDLRTTRGSRYATLDERSAAAALRIRHAWTTSDAAHQSATFTARAHGDIHEVVWTRPGESDFFVVEVTDQDVRAWENLNGKTNRGILANLLADRLSALSETPPNS